VTDVLFETISLSALGGEGHEEEKAPLERKRLQLLPRGASAAGGDIVSSPVSQTPSEPAAAAAADTSAPKMSEHDAKQKIKNMYDEFYGIKDKNVSKS
jgi:translation initiation factor 4G